MSYLLPQSTDRLVDTIDVKFLYSSPRYSEQSSRNPEGSQLSAQLRERRKGDIYDRIFSTHVRKRLLIISILCQRRAHNRSLHREGDEDSNGAGQCKNVRIESPHVAQLQPSQCANVRKNVCHARVSRKP